MPASIPIRHGCTFTSRVAIRLRETFFAQNDCALLIQSNQMQRVLTSIENRVDSRDNSLAGHGDALLVLFESPKPTL
jgi:hypothetical protein